MGLTGRVAAGPADTSIYDTENPQTPSIGKVMESGGVYWERANKARKLGWEAIRERLKASFPPAIGGVRESPGLFVLDTCLQFIETVPVLQRDEKDPDDADTGAEDHIADETRYRVLNKRKLTTSRKF
jgi:hypothetical protein